MSSISAGFARARMSARNGVWFALCAACCAGLQAAEVRLAWDPNPPEEGVLGYTVYFRDHAVAETNQVNAGNQTTAAVANLQTEHTYTFFVTAYNEAGESDPSDPLTHTISEAAPVVELSWDAAVHPETASYKVAFGEVNTTGTNLNAGNALELDTRCRTG